MQTRSDPTISYPIHTAISALPPAPRLNTLRVLALLFLLLAGAVSFLCASSLPDQNGAIPLSSK